ncbi:hypothetical protein AAMO2058_000154000 [Amorphochlora amoebiformis]
MEDVAKITNEEIRSLRKDLKEEQDQKILRDFQIDQMKAELDKSESTIRSLAHANTFQSEKMRRMEVGNSEQKAYILRLSRQQEILKEVLEKCQGVSKKQREELSICEKTIEILQHAKKSKDMMNHILIKEKQRLFQKLTSVRAEAKNKFRSRVASSTPPKSSGAAKVLNFDTPPVNSKKIIKINSSRSVASATPATKQSSEGSSEKRAVCRNFSINTPNYRNIHNCTSLKSPELAFKGIQYAKDQVNKQALQMKRLEMVMYESRQENDKLLEQIDDLKKENFNLVTRIRNRNSFGTRELNRKYSKSKSNVKYATGKRQPRWMM